ncbi:PH domain-containing protein [Fodinibius halophilus]|uniref:PH domain-containing protein n=1 Tax=Fodinibius halophilus TaxID=1736908 RepID=A0A6M1T1Q1_9BACT|nr:PH domain-containing protein [Fodinibius halophilus]NGP87909.1 PH domain-containing protein [Fodinibius halophilus]
MAKSENRVILEGKFNPKIKIYLLVYLSLILTVTVFGILLLPVLWIVGWTFVKRYFNRLSAELTDRALRFEKGLLFHVERTIPLDKIQDLTFKEGPLLRFFGLSILKVETAGSSGAGQADLTLIGIQDASAFRNKVLEQRDMVTESKYSTGSAEADASTLSVLKEIRDSIQVIEQKIDG